MAGKINKQDQAILDRYAPKAGKLAKMHNDYKANIEHWHILPYSWHWLYYFNKWLDIDTVSPIGYHQSKSETTLILTLFHLKYSGIGGIS